MRRGDPVALSRAISQIENLEPGFEALLAGLHPALGRAHRIGVTGPPGVGKSTLVQGLSRLWSAEGRRVGIVAVDPSSARTGGALLGDRIRMDRVALDDGVYIRSMATRGARGGLALATREVCDLLDAAGYDRIVVETVGVGQAELDVVDATDTTVVVLVPESGDGIQALKSGLMEVADVFVLNKADRPGADRMKHEIEVALHIRQGRAYAMSRSDEGRRGRTGAEEVAAWRPPVMATIATLGEGVTELHAAIERHREWLDSSGVLTERRRAQQVRKARDVLDRAVAAWVDRRAAPVALIEARRAAIAAGEISPYDLAAEAVTRLDQRSAD